MSPFRFLSANLCGACVSYKVDAAASVRHLTSNPLLEGEEVDQETENRQSVEGEAAYVVRRHALQYGASVGDNAPGLRIAP
jgi:hypothetical protein